MGLEQLMSEVSSELERLISTKTVIGEAVTAGDTTIIPVTKVSFGFGTGGGEGKRNTANMEEGFGGGGGAGAKIEPVAFIVISEDNVRVMPISPKTDVGVIIDSVPAIIDKIKGKKAKNDLKDIKDVKSSYYNKTDKDDNANDMEVDEDKK